MILFGVWCCLPQIRGHCVADLDPLGITQARHAETEEEARNKLLTTYRYHTLYNIGKVAQQKRFTAADLWCLVSAISVGVE